MQEAMTNPPILIFGATGAIGEASSRQINNSDGNSSSGVNSDNSIYINWPIKKPLVSYKDKKLLTFQNFRKNYKGL